MKYIQRYFEGSAEVENSYNKNKDIVLKVPNVSLIKRLLVSKGKAPWFFYKKTLSIAYPPQTKRSGNIVEDVKSQVELRSLNNEWQEESGGLFGLKEDNQSLDKNKTSDWYDRTK